MNKAIKKTTSKKLQQNKKVLAKPKKRVGTTNLVKKEKPRNTNVKAKIKNKPKKRIVNTVKNKVKN